MRPNELSYKIIGAAFEVHTDMGPGLVEGAYDKCLCKAFTKAGLGFERQVMIPVEYQGVRIIPAFKADFVIEKLVLIELKCVDAILPIHRSQLVSYLRLSRLPLGLLLNFRVAHMRDGITRIINAPEKDL